MSENNYYSEKSTILIFMDILLGVLRYTPIKKGNLTQEEFDKEITKRLKFNKITDYKLLRSCIDIIEDSQYAILEVYTHGLEVNNGHYGEKYLRLYGVLNAIYLQFGAIVDLMRLFNVSKQKIKREELKNNKIIELRNKIGSHTTNYKIPNSDNENDFFKLAQSTIDKWGSHMLLVGKNGHEHINLIENMKIFTLHVETILDDIISDVLSKRTFKKEHFDWMNNRYQFLKNERIQQD